MKCQLLEKASSLSLSDFYNDMGSDRTGKSDALLNTLSPLACSYWKHTLVIFYKFNH